MSFSYFSLRIWFSELQTIPSSLSLLLKWFNSDNFSNNLGLLMLILCFMAFTTFMVYLNIWNFRFQDIESFYFFMFLFLNIFNAMFLKLMELFMKLN